jgi:MBOAT, membrane-bound O-acyltransferase family
MNPAVFSSTLFANKLTDDDRHAWWLLEDFSGYRVGVLAPAGEFHTQILLLISFQILISVLFGFAIWRLIIQPIQERNDGKVPVSSLCIGLCLVIPSALILPFLLFEAIDLRSFALRFGCIFIPLIVPLKCLDALFGVDSVDRRLRMASLQHYLYYSFQIIPKYSLKNEIGGTLAKDKRIVVPCTVQSLSRSLLQFSKWFFLSILLNQVLSAFDFAPCPVKNPDRDPASDLYPTFELSRLINSYLQLLAFYLSLRYAFYGVACCNELLGNMQATENPFEKQPLFLAASPSDFGRRWNSLIHHHLKEGIYKPARAAVGWNHAYSKVVSTLATFLASGLIHEYVWVLLFFRTSGERTMGEYPDSFHPVFGKNFIFFGWCCLWVMVEKSVVWQTFFAGIAPSLNRVYPPVYGALLVLCIGCPIVHLFTECLVHGKYFDHLRLAGPWLVLERF